MSNRDSDLLWVQCTSMDLLTVSNSDSNIAIAKSGMGVAPILVISDYQFPIYSIQIANC